jgi:hypothetical protein
VDEDRQRFWTTLRNHVDGHHDAELYAHHDVELYVHHDVDQRASAERELI